MKVIYMLAISLCLFSCATLTGNKRDVTNLEARINAYYSARCAMDFKDAFHYEHMSLDGKFTDAYYMTNAAKSPMKFREAGIVSIDMQENRDVALVKMKVKYRVEQLPGFEKFNSDQEQVIEDRWEFVDENWYHMIRGVSKNW